MCLRPLLPGLFLQEYLGKPVATVEAFRNLWFHTGDAAYCDDAGAFYFVDRPGDRIRARGEDVTSFQMEDLVNSSPDVELSAAFPIRATEGDEDDVVVFVVPRAGVVLTAKDLHAWADREMPKYMRPEHVRIVDDIPRTPTNKIEKYKLRAQILRRAAQPVTAVRTVRYGPEEVGGVTHPAAAQPGHRGQLRLVGALVGVHQLLLLLLRVLRACGANDPLGDDGSGGGTVRRLYSSPSSSVTVSTPPAAGAASSVADGPKLASRATDDGSVGMRLSRGCY